MGSLGSPKTWVPYMNTKDCSQGFCSLYCPQWCYIIFPPPPPFTFPDDNSGVNFSPLVIAIIGILASAFLLVSYYAIISKFCGNMGSSRRRENRDPNAESEENRDSPSDQDQWHLGNNGLDESLIKSITVFKYTKRDGIIEGTECSVCLSEFEEEENLRLLPKCNHAFHVTCIDMWLKSHSNCPLCRANIVFINASPSPLSPPVIETSRNYESNTEDIETGQAQRDIENVEERDTVIEIRDDGDDDDDDDFEEDQQIRRSVSTGYLCQRRILISDVLQMNLDDDLEVEEVVGSSKRDKNRVLHCVTSPVLMKRSLSSGRFSFSKHRRGRKIVIPV